MHFLARLALLSMLLGIVACMPPETDREGRGTFYLTNPSGSTCTSSDDKAGYCLMHGCLLNSLKGRGRCAFQFGSCCIAEHTCEQTTNANNTYFINPDPATKLGPCEMVVKRAKNICQLRLDFVEFNIEQPDEDGKCTNDVFAVKGAAKPVPGLCGNLTGQHVYIEVDPLTYQEAVTLSVNVEDITLTNRKWIVKVSYIDCHAPHSAPKGCMQYFTGTNGTVKSFNYGEDIQKGTRMLTNMAYGICVRQETGYCGITWKINEKDKTYGFTLTGDAAKAKTADLGSSKLSRTKCSENENFLLIPDGKDPQGRLSERHCGLGFPKSVSSQFAPYVFRVNIGPKREADNLTRGFSLQYLQTKC